jgi:hypothetical protein
LSYFVTNFFTKADPKAVNNCLWRGSFRHAKVTRYCLIQPDSITSSTKLTNTSTKALMGALNNREDKQSLPIPSYPALPRTARRCTYKCGRIWLLLGCSEGEFVLNCPVVEGMVEVRLAGILCAVERYSKFTNSSHKVATTG